MCDARAESVFGSVTAILIGVSHEGTEKLLRKQNNDTTNKVQVCAVGPPQ
jgi:hypothetical protein